eukprot:CAMPEP_0204615096 /NCGR_PEP_ID=MMETSP0717-20131115/2682_1 /ASSEMBLY_ACC=CAM_ASM_000666 /TAXON_ID=230516 /ORGANISM="Chaetoceros curvisetus" /LENGTH=250 /DNA_ID=CAMNT_0051627957 /DNA_START=204 /DNA_END=956 /DNA_ORIENTATION=-
MGLVCTKGELNTSFLCTNTNRQRKLNEQDKEEEEMSQKQTPQVKSVEDVGSTRWLALKTIHYTNFKGEDAKWDMASRTTKTSIDKPDAAIVIPILKSIKHKTLDTLLIQQYRPPIQNYAMEFPAGLIDDGETPEQAAIREFKEETGYTGTVDTSLQQSSKLLCMTPGLTNETVSMVVLNVDMDDPINDNPKQHLEGDEDIDLKRVPLVETLKSIMDDSSSTKEKSCLPVALLYAFALGVELGLKHATNSE